MKKLFLILFIISVSLYSTEVETILSDFADVIVIPNLTGDFSMKLISSNGEEREYKATAYQKLTTKSQMNRLFVFSYPPAVRNTGLLIHSFYGDDGDENKMWMYLPVVKRVKRITLATAGSGNFMGSDFSYRDFISKSSSDFTQELVGEENLDGRVCYLIKEYGDSPDKREALGYDYIINYYSKADNFLYGRDYYELSGDLLKTYRVQEIMDLSPYIYPTKIIMKNVITNHSSVIEVTDINTDSISDKIFTTQYLKRNK